MFSDDKSSCIDTLKSFSSLILPDYIFCFVFSDGYPITHPISNNYMAFLCNDLHFLILVLLMQLIQVLLQLSATVFTFNQFQDFRTLVSSTNMFVSLFIYTTTGVGTNLFWKTTHHTPLFRKFISYLQLFLSVFHE